MSNPNFLEGFETNNYQYLGEDFTVPDNGESGWHETEDGHVLPWQIIGDLEGADKVAVLHHGGPGDSIKESHIAPVLGIPGLAALAYNQRLSGSGDKYARFEGNGDPLDTHSPELLVQDIEDLRETVLDGRKIGNIGGSWGSALSLLHGETHPDASDEALIWSVTLARTKEALSRYEADGDMDKAVPAEFRRFIELVPEEDRDNPAKITEYYDRMMNPTLPEYDEGKAKELAVAFGLLHLSAADPEGIGALGLAELPSEQLYPLAESMGIKPDLYARVAMRFFAEHFPRMGAGEGQIIRNIGRLAGKSLYIVSGGEDPLTPASAAEELLVAAESAGVNVERNLVEGGHHDRSHAPMQNAIREGAVKLFS